MPVNTLHNLPLEIDEHELFHIASNRVLGFWVYLMSDCILFATLFATYAVLSTNYAGGPTGKEIFNLHDVLTQTFCLLISSFTCGLTILAVHKNKIQPVVCWLIITLLLGLSFNVLELREFSHLINDGHTPQRSAFLSAFFTLVGTHGLHVFCGCIWIMVMIGQVIKKGLILSTKTRLILFSLFWHLLDVIWICIFTLVYLMGSM